MGECNQVTVLTESGEYAFLAYDLVPFFGRRRTILGLGCWWVLSQEITIATGTTLDTTAVAGSHVSL